VETVFMHLYLFLFRYQSNYFILSKWAVLCQNKLQSWPDRCSYSKSG